MTGTDDSGAATTAEVESTFVAAAAILDVVVNERAEK